MISNVQCFFQKENEEILTVAPNKNAAHSPVSLGSRTLSRRLLKK